MSLSFDIKSGVDTDELRGEALRISMKKTSEVLLLATLWERELKQLVYSKMLLHGSCLALLQT